MKTKVFGLVFWISLVVLIFDTTMVVIILTSGQTLDLFSWVIMVIMMILLPDIIFAYSLILFYNTIMINETGVYRIRFRKIVRHFKWEEIKTIGFTSEDTFTGWCYISTISDLKFSYLQVDKMRFNPNVICFHLTNKNKIEFSKMMQLYYNQNKSI